MNPYSRQYNFLLGLGAAARDASFSHPENDGIPALADGLALENQWGAVHMLKNITPEDEEGMWGHEEAEQRDHTGDWEEDKGEHDE